MSVRARLEQRLLEAWYEHGVLPWWLQALRLPALLTARVSGARRARIHAAKQARRRSDPAPRPRIVVVGNLVAGGSGKTPICLALAEDLRARGWRVGLLARGDGAAQAVDPPRRVDPDDPDAARDGDEATLMALRSGLPVYAGRRRGAALALLMRECPDTQLVISDDGLQHEALPRDLELAVFDRRGLGNGRLLPAGPLREGPRAAATFDALIQNLGADGEPAPRPVAHRRWHLSRLAFSGVVSLADWRSGARPEQDGPASTALLQRLRRQRVAAVAGIARPDGFFSMLHSLGLRMRELRPGDHRTPEPRWWHALDEPAILMTEKDAVKCPLDDDGRLFVACVRALPDPALLDWLEEALRGPTST
ncbi:MAG: tetraacyldisaccharide 4'-kinase [Burkholderiaceae bacterium]